MLWTFAIVWEQTIIQVAIARADEIWLLKGIIQFEKKTITFGPSRELNVFEGMSRRDYICLEAISKDTVEHKGSSDLLAAQHRQRRHTWHRVNGVVLYMK